MVCVKFVWYFWWVHTVLKMGYSNVYSKFGEFEELKPSNFNVVVKRDAVSGQVRFKVVSFFALRKYFVLYLWPGTPVLREGSEAKIVHADGKMTPVEIDPNHFFTGFFNGNPQHAVDAVHVEELWIAQIYTPDDVYSIEPMTHHVPGSSSTSVLIFRERDINHMINTGRGSENAGLHHFCEEVQFDRIHPSNKNPSNKNAPNKNSSKQKIVDYSKYKTKTINTGQPTVVDILFAGRSGRRIHHSGNTHGKFQHTGHSRGKRSNSMSRVYDTCDTMAVADYETYRGIGQGSVYRAISLLVHVYQLVDRVFRETIFGDLTNMGIVVSQFLVHTEYTADTTAHYNMAKNVLTGVETLISMTTISSFGAYCMAHLTTQRNFGGTLGLAATAESITLGWHNGICARQQSESRNVALSTPINANSELLPFLTYMLVVSHEIGHNWGSHHDPTDDAACSPTAEKGGKFIMWSYSGQSSSSNSRKFSPCSRREISNVLNGKAHLCFMPRELVARYCGNGIVDPGEDCDAGHVTNDICCSSICRFPAGAVCSPYNHACCTDKCQVAPRTQKCKFSDTNDCYETPYCSGSESHGCPQPRPLPNNSSCQDLGRCLYGKCVPFCELLGLTYDPPRRLEPCSVDKDRSSMCRHSCWDPGFVDACQIMGGPQKNGTPCLLGFCKAGICTHPESEEDILPYEYLDSESKPSHAHRLVVSPASALTCLSWIHFLFTNIFFQERSS